MNASTTATRRAKSRLAFLSIALTFVAGCDLSATDPFGGRLVKIQVTQGAQVHVGDTVRLNASGSVDGLASLFNYDAVTDATWSVSDASIAGLEPAAPPATGDWTGRILVRGKKAGDVTVTASARGVHGEAVVHVLP